MKKPKMTVAEIAPGHFIKEVSTEGTFTITTTRAEALRMPASEAAWFVRVTGGGTGRKIIKPGKG